jgi:hypothetical protein
MLGMLMDKKKLLSGIMSKEVGVKNGVKTEEYDVKKEYDMASKEAANQLLSAIESKDSNKIISAFKALMYCCDEMSEEMPEEESDGEVEIKIEKLLKK